MSVRSVLVEVLPRIHIGLLSMHENAPRANGGIGFAIKGPRGQIEVREASQLTVYDERRFPMAPSELQYLSQSLEMFANTHRFRCGAEIRIRGDIQTHVGMGSGTAIRLGTIEALALLKHVRIEKELLIKASGRGGTSGIGVNSYFEGGLVCDLGRPNNGLPFGPSSQIHPARPPLALPIVHMPNWPMLLCIPRGCAPKTQHEEVEFFKRIAPLPAFTSFEATYVALFQIYAAVAEQDYAGFCRGIEQMQLTAWKGAERAEYGGELARLDAALHEVGGDCIGMSSLGPMLFCFADPKRFVAITETARAMGCDVHESAPVNRGREVLLNGA